MPELHNEVPSEDELHEYFKRCLADTTLSWLRTPAGSLAANHAKNSVDALLSLRLLGADQFYDHSVGALFQTLTRLNGMPRSDPFWHNTNNRPTWFKIPDFCRRVLLADPRDELALWALGALDVVAGDHFGQWSWTRLHALGRFELPWAVCAAYMISGSAPDDVDQLVCFLLSRTSADEARSVLEPFRLRGAGDLPEWIEIVEARLNTSVIGQALVPDPRFSD
jgi:hypothetical protein